MYCQSFVDITEQVDVPNLECLNDRPSESIRNLFPPTGALLQSNSDAQLLMNLPFKEPVKLHSLVFLSPADGRRPNDIKLFVNHRVMDFGTAEDTPGTQEGILQWSPHTDGRMIATLSTKFVKFQDVKNVCLFIQNNVEDVNTTAISAINLMGSTLSTLNIKDLKSSCNCGK